MTVLIKILGYCSLIVAATLAGQGVAAAAPRVLVFGDSISAAYGIQREQGWVHLLAERLEHIAPGSTVINASVSGETTGGGLARLPAVLAEHDPTVVVIELGGNDGLRGYPVRSIRANLNAMVELADPERRTVIVVGMQIPPNYGQRYTNAFKDMFRAVAEEYEVALVPFLLEDVALEPGLMQNDGIHPTAAGQPLMLGRFWSEVGTNLFDVEP
jgi:acyl-CoA thioesterase-1